MGRRPILLRVDDISEQLCGRQRSAGRATCERQPVDAARRLARIQNDGRVVGPRSHARHPALRVLGGHVE